MQDAFLQSLESMIGVELVDVSHDPPVFRPASIPQLADLVGHCHEECKGIVITGGGTYPGTGNTDALVYISTCGLETVTEVNVDDFIVVAQAGTVVDDLVSVAGQFGLHLPFSLSSGDRATIGGTYMTGAFVCGQIQGGLGRMVTGVRAVAGNGDIITFGGRTVKNVTGFDVTRFLGGTLGLYAVAAELTFKALPKPEYSTTVTVTVPEGCVQALVRFLSEQVETSCMDCILLAPKGLAETIITGASFEGFKDIVNKDVKHFSDGCDSLCGSAVKTRSEVRFVKEHRTLAIKLAIPGMHTLTVPPASVPVLIDRLMVLAPSIPLIGHLNHGRLHLAGIDDTIRTSIDTLSRSLGGTALMAWGQVGERGLASLLTAPERALAQSLKRELDPRGILNPHIRL